jgi:zinc/manganese transport system substrate-binding protein
MMNPDQILHPVRLSALLASLFFALGDGKTQASINVVAAENFYGDVAQQIGGDQVDVTSILTNPDQDPHLFTVNVDTAHRSNRHL